MTVKYFIKYFTKKIVELVYSSPYKGAYEMQIIIMYVATVEKVIL